MVLMNPSFRKKNAAGAEVTDTAAIHAYVDKHYPGVTSASATGAAEEIVDKNSKGETVVRRADAELSARRSASACPRRQRGWRC